MAKASRVGTNTRGIFKVGPRFEWVSYKTATRPQQGGTCDTYAEARAAKQTADARGATPERARGTFGEHALEWIEGYRGRTRRGFSESSRQRYREGLELYAIPFFDKTGAGAKNGRRRRLGDIKRADMEAFVTWLERHDDRGGKRLTSSTIERTLAPLTAMFSDAKANGLYVGEHPTNGIRANIRVDAIDLDADDNAKRAVTIAQLARILDRAGTVKHGYPDVDVWLPLLPDTGVRWGEFAELRGRDFKASKQGPVLAVRRAWDAKTQTVSRPKGWRAREIPVSPELARQLTALQRGPNELLFTSPLGQRLNYQNTLTRVLQPILEAASAPDEDGVADDVTWAAFHTFRHTFATLLVDAGAKVKRVSKMLGHHKASFTLDYYAHLFDDDLGPTVSVGALLAEHREGQAGGRLGAGSAAEHPLNDPNTALAETRHLRGERQ